MNFVKPHLVASLLVASGLVLAAASSSQSANSPPFSNLDQFVLAAGDEIQLEDNVQISSGDIASNNKIDIQKESIINGDLFADRVTIDKDATINGNISYNKLNIKKESQVLGTQTTPIQLPIVNLPQTPDFQTGIQNFKFIGDDNVLPAGNYRDITLEKNSKLTLTGGTYNLNKLELKENSTLIFNAPTTLNIQFKLKGQQKTSILPGQNLSPTDLTINYSGIAAKQEKEDDDEEIDQLLTNQEKKDLQEEEIGRPILFGKDSLLNFKLLAPKAKVNLVEQTTFRGQILAMKIKVEKDSILSRELTGVKIAKQEEIITDPEGGVYPISILLVSLTPDATFEDALNVAQNINGRIVGSVNSINLYQIEIKTRTIEELEDIINTVRSRTDLKVDGVFRDYLLPIEI